jgi:hypothetical protein
MKQTKAPITRKTLAAEDIYHLAEQFTPQHPRPKTTRGRNLLYPEALILTLALLQVAQQASYRQLLFGLAPPLLPHHALPALGTLLYRLQTLPEARWHELLTWLAAQGIALELPAKSLAKPLVLVEGTGWGFDTPYYAPYRRGAARRPRLWARVEDRGWLSVVRVAPRLYQQVRAQSRWRALGRLAEYGWALQERSRIEQVFGGVQGAYGSYMGCRRVADVRVRVWGQLVLWNRVPYLRVGGGGIFLLCVGCGGSVMVVW